MYPTHLPHLVRQEPSPTPLPLSDGTALTDRWFYFLIASVIFILLGGIFFRSFIRRVALRSAVANSNPIPNRPRRRTDPRHQTGPFAQNIPYTQQVIHVPAPPGVRASGASYILLTPDLPRGSHFSQLNVQPHHQRHHVPRYDPDNLPSFEVPKEEADNPCPICLGPLKDEPVSSGQCLHMMHTSCLKSWLTKDVKSACPVCRVSFLDGDDEAATLGDDVSVNTSIVARSSVDGAGPGSHNPHMVIR